MVNNDVDKVRRVLGKYKDKTYSPYNNSFSLSGDKNLVLDLIALIEEARVGKKEWCKHWKWNDAPAMKCFSYTGSNEHGFSMDHATDDWDICPVEDCHAPRPEE